ncbi:unnamed protein product [Pedinophyceae sp. YPF-701]|nr:unnamed protein product [Pedinophyceae sp. YPF-701]
MAAVLLDPVMNLVDTALVGRLGAANLAGAGTAGLIFSFSSWLFGFLAMVTTPKVAVARAKGNHEEAYRQVGQTIFLAASIGCCLAAGFWVGAEKLAGTLAHGDPAVLGHATTYLKCRALSAPFLLVQFVAFGSFRGMKDTRTPLLASVLSNITNLLLDCLFIFGFGWGVAGASIASSIAVTVGCTTALTLLCRKGMIKARYVFRIPPWSDVLPTFTAGLSLSLRTISGMAAVLTATSCISWLGAAPLAAHEILRQMWILTIMAYEGFNAAANALIAVGVGQGRPDRAAGVFRRLMELSGIWGLAVGLSLWFARHQIAATFTTDPAVAMVVLAIFPLLTALQPLDAMVGVMDGTMYGLQEHKFIGMSMAVTTAFCLSTLFGLWQVWPSVMAVWVSLKVLTIGRGVAGTWKLTRKDSFLMEAARMRAEEQELNGARGTNGNGGGGPLPAPAATG